jgi:hypothetical protein
METREVLLKADKVSVSFERLDGGKIRVGTSSWDDPKVILAHQVLEVARQAGRAGPGRQADRLLGHRRHRARWRGLRPCYTVTVTVQHGGCDALRRN